MQGYCDVFSTDYFDADIYRNTFTCDVINVEHSDASNVIYQKFSHGAVSYTLNEEDINVMLELSFMEFGSGVT